MTVLTVPTDALRPSAYNPRKADSERLEMVGLSLRKLGWLLPIYADPNGEILSGHQRHLMATRLGATVVPVVTTKKMPQNRRMAVNLMYNRGTNDMQKNESSATLQADLARAHDAMTQLMALPDIDLDDPEQWPVTFMSEQPVAPLLEKNPLWRDGHGLAMARQMHRTGLPLMPVVTTEDGRVVNGAARLAYAAERGEDTVEVVVVADEVAEPARMLLNRLTMDFTIEETYADLLRHNSFRRPHGRMTYLGTVFTAPLARGNRTNIGNFRPAAFDPTNPRHVDQWKRYFGETVLDFGAGLCDKTDLLVQMGVDAVPFEPYFLAPNSQDIDPDAARLLCRRFLDRVAEGTRWDSIFLNSVLNSVPFLTDRMHVVTIVAALASKDTGVFAAAASVDSTRYRHHGGFTEGSRGSKAAASGFAVDYEPGVILSDVATLPKVQKFHSLEEFANLWRARFDVVTPFTTNGYVLVQATRPKPISRAELEAAIEFEFDLPMPDGSTLGLVEEAKKALLTEPAHVVQ